MLSVVKMADGKTFFRLANEGWTVKDREVVDLAVLLDQAVFTGKARGLTNEALMLVSSPEMLAKFAAAKYLVAFLLIDEDSEVPLESFDLTGSSAALRQVDLCHSRMVKRVEAERKDVERLQEYQSSVPADPFSSRSTAERGDE